MADPKGGNKYWFNGIPIAGVNKPAISVIDLKFWFNGLPYSTLFPTQSYAAFSTPQAAGVVSVDMIGI